MASLLAVDLAPLLLWPPMRNAYAYQPILFYLATFFLVNPSLISETVQQRTVRSISVVGY